jgi:hypothetical protein
MRPLLAFLPLSVLALVVAALRCGVDGKSAPFRESLLQATVILGAGLLLATEILGAAGLLGSFSVIVFWSAALVAAAGALAHRWQRYGPPAAVEVPNLDSADRLLLAALAATALVLFVVAWLSPPQSSDSIGYHMARVMHWIQNRSVMHYPTADPPQLFEPPFAEMVRLHLLLLSGSDRAGCLLQWFAAMVSLAGASLVARDLGGSRRAQIFAAVLAVTLPIGVAQASSGKNGWVETVWLLSLVHFGGWFQRGRSAPASSHVVAAFAALGLQLATKISAWLFAPPFVVWAMARALRDSGIEIRRFLLPALTGSALVLAIAAPYLLRNFSLYGHPLVDPVYRAKNELELVTPASVASNLVRNAAFQLGTGVAPVDAALTRVVKSFHERIDLAVSDPRTTQFGPFEITAPSRAEEEVPSPLHVLLLFATGAALLVSRRTRANTELGPYLLALAAAYLAYSTAIQWQPANCRLLMPLLVLAAPLTAVVFAETLRGYASIALSVLLFAAAVPYIVGLPPRPLTFEEGRGILATPREDLYFARVRELQSTYREVASRVLESQVRNLGVVFSDDNEPEYLLFMLLEEADPPVRIENVMVRDASARLADVLPFRDFRPEMVVIFAANAKNAHFERTITAAGRAMVFRRRVGLAGIYEPDGPHAVRPATSIDRPCQGPSRSG